jgi:AraC-like DNA-binding protein
VPTTPEFAAPMIEHPAPAQLVSPGEGPTIGPYDEVLWTDRQSVLGRFDAEPDSPDFADAGPIGSRPAIAFPQSAVRIEPEGEEGFISDPTMAVLHNPHRRYTRHDLIGAGDHCDWISVQAETLGALSPFSDAGRGGPFVRSSAPIEPRAYALMRLLVRYLHTVDRPDRTLVRRLLSDVIVRVLRGLGPEPGAPRAGRAFDRHTMLVDDVKSLLLQRFAESWTVESIAETVGSSPFHLCRIFRDRTGYTLHRYLTELRLRESLGRLENETADLTDLALDLGFCSHSHFTDSFGRTFGVPPSDFRKCADELQVRRLHRRLVS